MNSLARLFFGIALLLILAPALGDGQVKWYKDGTNLSFLLSGK